MSFLSSLTEEELNILSSSGLVSKREKQETLPDGVYKFKILEYDENYVTKSGYEALKITMHIKSEVTGRENQSQTVFFWKGDDLTKSLERIGRFISALGNAVKAKAITTTGLDLSAIKGAIGYGLFEKNSSGFFNLKFVVNDGSNLLAEYKSKIPSSNNEL